MAAAHETVIESASTFSERYPIPDALTPHFQLDGQRAFIETFVPTRNAVETAYYANADKLVSKQQRTRKFLGAMFTPMLGKPLKDAETFYQTYGRSMRWAWLSISLGIYNEAIEQINDTQLRLNLAQVNTVDTAWRPAVSRLVQQGGEGTIVEVGTGRGNSVVRLAQLFPNARIVSVTISAEQCEIATGIVRQLGLNNVEVRLGDIFDPAIYSDLLGQADAVGAIEVTGHFPHDKKPEGMRIFADLLKPGAPLSLMDTALVKPITDAELKYYNNQCWYFGDRAFYESSFQEAGLDLTGYLDYMASMTRTLEDTAVVLAKHRGKLRQEFGLLMALLWPLVPRLNIMTAKKVAYVHIIGHKIA